MLILLDELLKTKPAIIPHLEISSNAFNNGGQIPKKYTGDGQNMSPPIYISHFPEGTKSLTLVVEDADAGAHPYIHWLVWNIPAVHSIEEDSIPGIEGINVFKQHRYCGPYAPSATHHYSFKIYALDADLNLPPDTEIDDLEKAQQGHILGFGELTALYH